MTTFRLSWSLIDEMMDFLRDVGSRGFEGLVLWTGTIGGEVAEVRTVHVPAQETFRTNGGGTCVRIKGDELHRLNVWLYQNRQRLLAQVHTHPDDAYHSDTDDEFAIATEVGSLSLVLPDFGRHDFSLSTAAIYRLTSAGRWTVVAPRDVRQLIQVD